MSTQAEQAFDLSWTFGDRLRKVRRVLKLSQDELAETIQQGRKSVAAWESGTVNEPRNAVAIAKRIELAYGIPASWLLGLNAKTPGPDGPGVSRLPGPDSDRQPFGIRLGRMLAFPERLAA